MYWKEELRGSLNGSNFCGSVKGLGQNRIMEEKIHIREKYKNWDIPAPKTPVEKYMCFFAKSLF